MCYVKWANANIKKLRRKMTLSDLISLKLTLIFFGFLLVYWIPAILKVNVWVWFILFIITGFFAFRPLWRK